MKSEILKISQHKIQSNYFGLQNKMNKNVKKKGNQIINNDNFSRSEIKDFDDSIFENFIEEIDPKDFNNNYGEILYGGISLKKRKKELKKTEPNKKKKIENIEEGEVKKEKETKKNNKKKSVENKEVEVKKENKDIILNSKEKKKINKNTPKIKEEEFILKEKKIKVKKEDEEKEIFINLKENKKIKKEKTESKENKIEEIEEIKEEETKLDEEKMEKWIKFGLNESVLINLQNKNFTIPTNIQEKVIPMAIIEKKDLIIAAETGSGKTLAFG
jgi:ATP-dependent RNA helicase DDX24/MAK5